ncbi:methyl-accepting chemotaxis protein [Endozoicomonas sp. 4G]|uniref:methyl-accepting chemotaxis protein n=1 Tax=Endozoicomonas sp. 4G TaxID=2872754 RepID=UPI002078AA0E
MKGNTATSVQGAGTSRAILASIFLLILSLSVITGSFIFISQQSRLDQQHLTDAGELRVLSQRIATSATEAADGKEEAFILLREARNEFDERFTSLQNTRLSVAPLLSSDDGNAAAQIETLGAAWSELKVEADNILAAETTVIALHEVAKTLGETIIQLQVEYDEVVQILLENGAPNDQIAMAQRQPWLAERIIRSASKVLEGGEDAIMAADSFGRDAKLFGRVLNGMLEGDLAMRISQVTDAEAIDRLAEISDLFGFVEGSVDEILETTPELFRVRAAADQIFTDSRQLLQQTSILVDTFESLTGQRLVNNIVISIAGVVALFSLLMIALTIVKDTRQRLAETAARNEANQAAIQRLLDEMADLADGDLTVQATVTEDFTGAIADSINFSIEQLRVLVKTINETAVEVDTSAQETQSTAKELAQAAGDQAEEINYASQAVNDMTESMTIVSASASESAQVADRSVAIATSGGQVVRNTIEGMDTIREQIQDTSRRIKRLGESSQEIGDIISLINDIAEQTNILSLNAAIQASMAGEAGRGFAVVADEVQRLAERVSGATRQIEALVSTIQTDTNEAVISMEQTTAEVVNGARLAQDAGVALEEVEKVSSSLAELIRNISETAKQQTDSAQQIALRMTTIRDITTRTASSTTATAGSVGNLAEMALEMRQSVSGFRLPPAAENEAAKIVQKDKITI